ncbi:YpjP family protein [Evansella sp. AB-rgal1]|uniref:YpjP family protein n=1 Tax=Evansella sp. AB-rgal1 TaxID=3242696 RepID=UPI00359D33D7
MKLWFKKISVILITFMTLGVFIPPTYLDAHGDNKEYSSNSNSNIGEQDLSSYTEDNFTSNLEEELDFSNSYVGSEEYDTSEYYIDFLTDLAKEQMVTKLGPKIITQVEEDLINNIMPNMEDVVKSILAEAGEEDIQNFSISEQPARGYGEKIFNIYNQKTNKEVARFDVRRDIRPKDGYWFNFHYHLSDDDFETHHELGEVYWDKNTPPKWMS